MASEESFDLESIIAKVYEGLTAGSSSRARSGIRKPRTRNRSGSRAKKRYKTVWIVMVNERIEQLSNEIEEEQALKILGVFLSKVGANRCADGWFERIPSLPGNIRIPRRNVIVISSKL